MEEEKALGEKDAKPWASSAYIGQQKRILKMTQGCNVKDEEKVTLGWSPEKHHKRVGVAVNCGSVEALTEIEWEDKLD